MVQANSNRSALVLCTEWVKQVCHGQILVDLRHGCQGQPKFFVGSFNGRHLLQPESCLHELRATPASEQID